MEEQKETGRSYSTLSHPPPPPAHQVPYIFTNKGKRGDKRISFILPCSVFKLKVIGALFFATVTEHLLDRIAIVIVE